MRRKFVPLLALLAFLSVVSLTWAAVAQPPAIDPQVIGGSGGRVAQGNITLHNTFGQPVADIDSEGTTELCAGFWCGANLSLFNTSTIYLPLVLR